MYTDKRLKTISRLLFQRVARDWLRERDAATRISSTLTRTEGCRLYYLPYESQYALRDTVYGEIGDCAKLPHSWVTHVSRLGRTPH